MNESMNEIGEEMKEITEQEMVKKIEEVSTNFKGQLDDLQAAVGMLVIGRFYGWRVMRLVSSRRHWTVTCKLFGDLKELLPERTALSNKSLAFRVVDKSGNYWDVIKGHSEAMPLHERKLVL